MLKYNKRWFSLVEVVLSTTLLIIWLISTYTIFSGVSLLSTHLNLWKKHYEVVSLSSNIIKTMRENTWLDSLWLVSIWDKSCFYFENQYKLCDWTLQLSTCTVKTATDLPTLSDTDKNRLVYSYDLFHLPDNLSYSSFLWEDFSPDTTGFIKYNICWEKTWTYKYLFTVTSVDKQNTFKKVDTFSISSIKNTTF